MTGQRCPKCEAVLNVLDDCYECLCITASKSMSRYHGRQETCKRGHAYTPENTVIEIYKGKENNRCRKCLTAKRRASHILQQQRREK